MQILGETGQIQPCFRPVRITMTAQIVRHDLVCFGKCRNLLLEKMAVDAPAMNKHDRLALTTHFIIQTAIILCSKIRHRTRSLPKNYTCNVTSLGYANPANPDYGAAVIP